MNNIRLDIKLKELKVAETLQKRWNTLCNQAKLPNEITAYK